MVASCASRLAADGRTRIREAQASLATEGSGRVRVVTARGVRDAGGATDIDQAEDGGQGQDELFHGWI